MAATLIAVSKVGASGITIDIKVNDGYSIPQELTDATDVDSFRIWEGDTAHILIWKTIDNREKTMLFPNESIGWVMASRVPSLGGDRFRINNPCTILVEPII